MFSVWNKRAKEKASMTQENPIVIEDREELIYMLSEAASLEHMIMCQYLFAAFSLKRNVGEGVTAVQNASYQVLLQVLIRYFIHGTESDDELTTLSHVAVDTMFQLIKPLGELLTRLPVG